MEEKSITIDNFKLPQFIGSILEFLKTQVSKDFHPSWAIVSVSGPGEVPEYGPEDGNRDIESELINENKILFFPFSSSNVGEPIPCADRKSYMIDEDSEFSLGYTDCAGYLFKYKGGSLIINSAVHAGGACIAPPPSVDIVEDCDVFELPMIEFLNKYIKTTKNRLSQI
jgi:hypothetical protein